MTAVIKKQQIHGMLTGFDFDDKLTMVIGNPGSPPASIQGLANAAGKNVRITVEWFG